jgi:hypothetical protein
LSGEDIEAWDSEIVIMPTNDELMLLYCSCGWDYVFCSSPTLETVNNIAVEHWKETHGRAT